MWSEAGGLNQDLAALCSEEYQALPVARIAEAVQDNGFPADQVWAISTKERKGFDAIDLGENVVLTVEWKRPFFGSCLEMSLQAVQNTGDKKS